MVFIVAMHRNETNALQLICMDCMDPDCPLSPQGR